MFDIVVVFEVVVTIVVIDTQVFLILMMTTTVFGGVNRQYVRLTPRIELMRIIRGIGGALFQTHNTWQYVILMIVIMMM